MLAVLWCTCKEWVKSFGLYLGEQILFTGKMVLHLWSNLHFTCYEKRRMESISTLFSVTMTTLSTDHILPFCQLISMVTSYCCENVLFVIHIKLPLQFIAITADLRYSTDTRAHLQHPHHKWKQKLSILLILVLCIITQWLKHMKFRMHATHFTDSIHRHYCNVLTVLQIS
jgi:hypothetical protein